MKDERSMAIVDRFFSGTETSYDRVVKLCTLGFDSLWKQRMLAKIPPEPAKILDQSCGTGILTFKIARKYPACRITGVDVTKTYLSVARKKAEEGRYTNVTLISRRAEEVVLDQSIDCITSSYLAKYAQLPLLVSNARKMLRAGGILIMHDFTYPKNRVYALAWELFFKVLQSIGVLIYPEWKPAFDDLPAIIRETTWVNDLISLLEENGFSHINVEYLTMGISAIISAEKT